MTARPACVWLTGPAGAGKSTIGRVVVDELRRRGRGAVVLDDDARAHLRDGSTVEGAAWLARMLLDASVVVVVAFDTPRRDERDALRNAVPGFVEIFVDGGAPGGGYEPPYAPELRVPTRDREPIASAAQVVSWLEDAGIVAHDPPHPSED